MKRITLVLVSCMAALSLNAQEISFGFGGVSNPTINPDHSVTFTFRATDVAKVEIEAGFLPPREIQTQWGRMQQTGRVTLPKSADGVFSWTSDPLESDYYNYGVYFDGVRVVDPNNVYHARDIANLNNFFIIFSVNFIIII